MRQTAASKLLDWYDAKARRLPWRVSPADRQKGIKPDPYQVWISEVMLQQTTVATVKHRYADFMAKWPTLADLAAASEADILVAWAGLGYYARARNLKAAADEGARQGGQLPSQQAELRRLPGFGPYTAAAVAAICHDEKVAVVDGNVERIVARLTSLPAPVNQSKKLITQQVFDMVPARSGDFAQAMMDLGATICTPKSPDCGSCPLQDLCQARRDGTTAHFPVKARKVERPTRVGVAFVAFYDNHVLLRRRPDGGLLAAMPEFPCSDFVVDRSTIDVFETEPPIDVDWIDCGVVTHTFTHFHLELNVMAGTVDTTPWMTGYWWQPETTIDDAGLPTLFKKVLNQARANS